MELLSTRALRFNETRTTQKFIYYCDYYIYIQRYYVSITAKRYISRGRRCYGIIFVKIGK